MAENGGLQCEFSLVRYVPDPVKDEFVNIGVVLRDAGDEGRTVLRLTQDWARVRCLDPHADIATLEGMESELRQDLARTPKLLEQVQNSWSNMVQITAPKGCLAVTFMSQLEQLMRLYVERQRQPREKARKGRTAVLGEMRHHFEREGVWDFMTKGIAAAKYTKAGDPLRIDCGYRTNGTMKMFQAMSLGSDVEAAVQLAFVSLTLINRVKEVENATLQLTAIIEPIREVGADQERRQQYAFGYETMAENNIRVMTTSDMARIAATARSDLRIQ